MRRAFRASTALSAVAAKLALVSLFAAGTALAQVNAGDAGPALNISEEVCVGQTLGSPCESQSTMAGGTCVAGCCCRYLTDPEGASVCAPCLACSDTAYLDPAYRAGACSDGGTPAPQSDSGVVPFVDSGATLLPPASPQTSPSSSGCSIGAPSGAGGTTRSIASLLLGMIALGGSGLARAQRASRRRRSI